MMTLMTGLVVVATDDADVVIDDVNYDDNEICFCCNFC